MKQRGSQSDRYQRPDQTVRKVKVLRAYLREFERITNVDFFDVDSSLDRDGVRGGGSRFGQLTGFLKPEVILCTSRNDTKAEFIVITTLDEPLSVEATPKALDTWLRGQGHESVPGEISNSIRVLQSAGSRLSNRDDKSQVSKAINVLRRFLLSDEQRPAA